MVFHNRYSMNRGIRTLAVRLMRNFADKTVIEPSALSSEKIEKILLVRPNFRMGNSILAIPAIDLFRERFPQARIDFVGTRVSKKLFQNLPIDEHYEVSRNYQSCWTYPALLRKLRSTRYDLAVELSCSQSALGSFIVGFSGARRRVGRVGKRDLWFNVKLPKSKEVNKYRLLPEFLAGLGFAAEQKRPRIALSANEKQAAKELLQPALANQDTSYVGVFVGARERHGKRWPLSNFSELAASLTNRGIRTVVFVGPEEKNLIRPLAEELPAAVPVISEPSLRLFAAMLSYGRLFVTCDSGPMHLACAVGVRTLAIFQKPHFDRWAPPAEAARVLYDPQGVSVAAAEAACLDELRQPNRSAVSQPVRQQAAS